MDKPPAGGQGDQNVLAADAFDSLPMAICTWTAELTVAEYNRRFVDIHGLDPNADWRGNSIHDFYLECKAKGCFPGEAAEDLAKTFTDRLETLAEDETLVTEHALREDEVVKVSCRKTGNGRWVAIYEDITEQKGQVLALEHREKLIAQQHLFLDAAVNNISQGLCMFDGDRRLIICNQPYVDIYRLPSSLCEPGTSFDDIVADHIRKSLIKGSAVDGFVRRRLMLAERNMNATDIVELGDGRAIEIKRHAMADGAWVSTHTDITERRRSEERISYLASHDVLTGLPNRLKFQQEIEAAESRLGAGDAFAVHFVDLDHYKAVNDLYGHAFGDAVLTEVGKRLTKACRDIDIVARIGGDEFAILQNHVMRVTAKHDTGSLASRIVRTMSRPFRIEGRHVTMGASVGTAVAPLDGRTGDILMRNADLALYQAKADGRDTHRFFEPKLASIVTRRLELEGALRRAVDKDGFHLAYQPIMRIADRQLAGFEALIRLDHPSLGSIDPEELVAVAEESGLIVAIGDWVLRAACREAVDWPSGIMVAVNVSPLQFRNRELFDQIKEALTETTLPPDRLRLELTETALFNQPKLAVDTLHRLSDLGVSLAIDDFGTGYSNFGHLLQFAFDAIKIDRSFVQSITKCENSVSIVRSIIGLSKSLNLPTIAEGVETQAQLDILQELGCDKAQGTILSGPISAEDARAMASKQRPAG